MSRGHDDEATRGGGARRTPAEDQTDARVGTSLVGVARWSGGEPLCALCAGPGVGGVALHHLTYGVSVMLCREHWRAASEAATGEAFAAELTALWNASGCMTARRHAALDAHTRRLRRGATVTRPQPGSYSWPSLRAAAERRFARGESPNRVIHELRAKVAGGDAIAPSIRTMRRWFCEARWLDAHPTTETAACGEPTTRPREPWLAWSARIMPLDQIPGLLRSPSAPFNLDYYGFPRGSPKRRG